MIFRMCQASNHFLILCSVVFYNPNLFSLYVIKIIDVTNTSRNLIRVTPQFCQSNISTSRPVRWTGSSGVPPPNVSPGELDQHIFGLHLVKTLDGDIQQMKLRFYRGLVDQTQYQFWWMNLGSTREILIPANYPENWSCGIFLKWGQLFLRLCRWLVKVDTKLWGYLGTLVSTQKEISHFSPQPNWVIEGDH